MNNRLELMKSTVPFLIFLSLTILMSCSGTPSEYELEPEDPLAWVSGVHYLHGAKTTTGTPCFHCGPDSDNLSEIVTYSVNVDVVEGKSDTIRFFGLYGADAGDTGDRVFPDCSIPDNCKVYASINSSTLDFEIDIENNGRRYHATGVISQSTLHLTAQYTHDNLTIEYELEGERVQFY